MSIYNGGNRRRLGIYNEQFIQLWEKVWVEWHQFSRNDIDCFNPREWETKFGTKVIRCCDISNTTDTAWAAIEFKDEAQLFLFMLEWA